MEAIDKNSTEITSILQMVDEIYKAYLYYKEFSKPLLNGEQFLDNKELSELLHISQRSLQDYRDHGKIPFYKLEGKILYKQSDILKFLADNYYESWKEEK